MNDYKQWENASILFLKIFTSDILQQCIKNYYHTFNIAENHLIYALYKCENFFTFFIHIHILNEQLAIFHDCLN